MTTRPWRQEIELIQNYPKHKTFTMETSSNLAEDAIVISNFMEEANKVSFIVETNDAYIAFDEDADRDVTPKIGMLIPANEGYFDDSVYLGSKITIMCAADGANARIRGIIWGR